MENKKQINDLKIRLLKETTKKRKIRREIAKILSTKTKEENKK